MNPTGRRAPWPASAAAAWIPCILALCSWLVSCVTPARAAFAAHPALPPDAPVFLEAENGAYRGVIPSTERRGFLGAAYLAGFDAGSDSVLAEFVAARSGRYEMYVRYVSQVPSRCYLELNGVPLGTVALPSTDGFAEARVSEIVVVRGSNRVLLLCGDGGYDLDGYRLVPVLPQPATHAVTPSLCTPDPSPAARRLMEYLVSQYGKTILAGQADHARVDWIFAHTGRKPALVAFDMMRYSPSMVERGATTDEVERAISWAREGGIVSFQWHWNAPTGLVGLPGREWYRGFYTEATTFDFRAALEDPGSAGYALLLRDIDAIAVQLARLRDEGVPVLWRPLHEADGGWFWWGSRGARAGIALYRLLFERLTLHHGLDNLIWVWSSPQPAWYPGDDVVDVVGFDSYPAPRDHGPVADRYEKLRRMVGDRRLVAMTENGAIPDPDLLAAFRADWSWFATWGEFVADAATNDPRHVAYVYAHPRVITLDELPAVSSRSTSTP